MDALKTYVDSFDGLYKVENWDELKRLWIRGVGQAQRDLPAHVVHEYCHPDRGFEPELTVEKLNHKPFPRRLKTDEGDWWVARYNGGGIGGSEINIKGFGVVRYNHTRAEVAHVPGWPVVAGTGPTYRPTPWWAELELASDHSSLTKLYEARTSQLKEIQSHYAQYQSRPGYKLHKSNQ